MSLQNQGDNFSGNKITVSNLPMLPWEYHLQRQGISYCELLNELQFKTK